MNLSEQPFSLRESFLLPMGFYLLWQLLYILAVEVVLSAWIKSDPDLEFALRCLARDADNGMHQLVLGLMKKFNIMEPTEIFQAETAKTKIIFISAQLVYTVITLAPVQILYSSFAISLLYISSILGWTVYQGADSYCQDFMERYKLTSQTKTN